MQQDESLIRQRYKSMSDDELTMIATKDGTELSLTAQLIIQEEVRFRRLDKKILEAVKAQNTQYSADEIVAYCQILQDLPCPKCKKHNPPLNATTTRVVVSGILFSTITERLIIGCPSCLDKASNNAILKSALLGWWELFSGIFSTLKSIRYNLIQKKTHNEALPNKALKTFTKEHIGEVVMYKNDPPELEKLIARYKK